MKKHVITFTLMTALCLSAISAQNIVKIKGSVHERDSKELYLRKTFDNSREINPEFVIPVVDGKFEYDLQYHDVVQYDLIFLEEYLNGAWISIPFFPDQPVIEFDLYPSPEGRERARNTVKGGVINQSRQDFEKLEEETFGHLMEPLWQQLYYLYDNELFNTPEMEALYDALDTDDWDERVGLFDEIEKMRITKEGYTPEAVAVTDLLDSMNLVKTSWKYELFSLDPDIYAYSSLLSDLIYRKENINITEAISLYGILSNKYPDHTYTAFAENLIRSFQLVPGSRYIEFSAPDLNGNIHSLSHLIDGKVAVIDLWASWCGPCLTKAVQLIPVFEKYKDKGFTVAGVAREYRNTDNFVKSIERFGLPWPNLVELNDANGIWEKYGVANAGGRTVLVDENGIVIYVDPSTLQVEEYLAGRFGE